MEREKTKQSFVYSKEFCLYSFWKNGNEFYHFSNKEVMLFIRREIIEGILLR